MNLKRGWRLASPTEKRQAEADRSFSHLSQIADLSPEYVAAGTFPISSEKAHKSAHRLQQVDLLWMVTFGNGNIDVLIVTLFLNEARLFSLINATQILCFPIGEIQAENPAGVIIVLIVLIVTLYLRACSESLHARLACIFSALFWEFCLQYDSVAAQNSLHLAKNLTAQSAHAEILNRL